MDNEQFQEFVVKHLMNLTEDVSSLKTTVTRIETRMEHEIINKINALFDSDKMQSERLDLHEKRIDLHEYKIDDLSEQLNFHENKLKSL